MVGETPREQSDKHSVKYLGSLSWNRTGLEIASRTRTPLTGRQRRFKDKLFCFNYVVVRTFSVRNDTIVREFNMSR